MNPALPPPLLLDNPILHYDWGSRHSLAELRGDPSRSAKPEAELWIGAHPKAPSRALVGGRWIPLDELIAASPERWLGKESVRRFGEQLPFLLKILAVATPLSIQVHPNRVQAERGFAREDSAGIPIDAPQRNYRDANPKPELVCALDAFQALCGVRRADEILDRSGDLSALSAPLVALRQTPNEQGVRQFLSNLLRLDAGEQRRCVENVLAEFERSDADCEPERTWIRTLAELHPGDIGVLSPLWMYRIELAAEEALFLGAGNLHAYLSGIAVELMANSDNVLRGGLTQKHVDVDEVLEVLDPTPTPPQPVPVREDGPAIRTYLAPVREFELSCIRPSRSGGGVQLDAQGAELILAASGSFEVSAAERGAGSSVSVGAGGAVFLPAGRRYLVRGECAAYRARSRWP